jgi:hypothetical protein
MRERGLRSVLFAHELADDKADVVLLNGYVATLFKRVVDLSRRYQVPLKVGSRRRMPCRASQA